MNNPFAEIPPPLPPKQSAPSRRQQQHQSLPPARSSTRNDSSHAHHSSRSADTPSRTRPNRSQTTGPYVITSSTSFLPSFISSPPPSQHSPPSSGSRPQPTQPRRSHSSDSTPSDKSKHHRSKTKKGSMHADVIDRLDFTGVGPSMLFSVHSSTIPSHSSHLHSVPPRWTIRCLRSISQQASHQGPHVRLDLYQPRR
jgi:hypothetical protein